MTPDEPDPQDVPEFDRALDVDDLVPDLEYGDQRYHPERGAVDGKQILVDELHETLLETALLQSYSSDVFQRAAHAHYTCGVTSEEPTSSDNFRRVVLNTVRVSALGLPRLRCPV
ncbi:hypothetical protein [Haloterrigena turkmenica]|nr:hypothetical protein [Haloterrigena turkmenica]